MDNIKNNSYYLRKAVDDINAVIDYVSDIKTYEEFLNNSKTVDAVMFRLVQLIENIKNIDSDYKEAHNEIPWGKIMGFRNGIVHEYGSTDYTIVYEIITKNIYDLKNLFTKTI